MAPGGAGWSMSKSSLRLPDLSEQQLLERVEVRLLGPDEEHRTRYRELMERHHYLKSDPWLSAAREFMHF